MTDVAAWVIYHIARANMIIGISACIGVPFSVGRNVTAALRWRDLPPVVAMPYCFLGQMNLVADFAITLGYLTTESLAPDAMAAGSSSVMSMARLNVVESVVLKVGGLWG